MTKSGKGLTPKLLGPVVAMIVFLIITLVLSLVESSRINAALNDLQNKTVLAIELAEDIRYEGLHTCEIFTDMSATRDAEVLEEAEEILDHMNALLSELKQRDQKYASDVDEIKSKYDALYDLCHKMARAYIEEGLEAGNAVMDEVDPMTESFSETVDRMVETVENELEDDVSSISRISMILAITTAVCSVINIALGLLIAFVVIRQVLGPILKVSSAISTLSRKDLTANRLELKQQDELGALADAYNDLLISTREIMGDLGSSTKKLGTMSDEMNTNSEIIVKNVNEITGAVNNVAETAGEQASDIQNSIIEIDSLRGIAKQNETAIENLADASTQISETSKAGTQVMNELYNATKESEQSFEQIFESISRINESTAKIGQSSDLIQSIASQTNLLSLNASIEAARAGEMGKGFAVVADEIRKLAEDSASSANEINEMLKELRANVDNANQQSESVKEAVERQVRGVEDTRTKYKDISDNLAIIDNEVQSLGQVSRTMTESCEKVGTAMEHLSEAAQSNAAASEETNASIEEVLALLQQIAEGSTDIRGQSVDLSSIVSKYKLS